MGNACYNSWHLGDSWHRSVQHGGKDEQDEGWGHSRERVQCKTTLLAGWLQGLKGCDVNSLLLACEGRKNGRDGGDTPRGMVGLARSIGHVAVFLLIQGILASYR